MASALVDLEDIAYIDDITDEDVVALEEDIKQKVKKRKKNRNVGESLQIVLNDKVVRELRKDRQDNKIAQDSINDTQGNKDIIDSPDEHTKATLDPRDVHTKGTSDLRDEHTNVILYNDECATNVTLDQNDEYVTVKEEINEERVKLNSVTELKVCKSNLPRMTKDYNSKMNKEIENKDKKKRVSGENVGKEKPRKSNGVEARGLENTVLEKCAYFRDEADAYSKDIPIEKEASNHSTDVIKIVKTESKSDSKSKGRRQRSSEYLDKENVQVLTSPDVDDITDGHVSEQDEFENDMTYLLQSNSTHITDITDAEKANVHGAKPKLFARRANGHDMQLKELNLKYYADENNESGTKLGNGKTSSKKKSKMKVEAYFQSRGSDIRILVTNEQGAEIDAQLSDSTTSTSKGAWNRVSNKSDTSTPSYEDTTPETDRSTPLNYLRKISDDNAELKGNNLQEQAELYKQQKAKPFRKLTKLKSGVFSVGIEGDSKRSDIKSITIMPDKKLVMFDRKNGCIKLFDKDFNPLDKVLVTTKHCSLTAVFDESFAATFPEDKRLQLYHIDNNTNKICQERTHPVEAEFYAIAHHHNKLYLIQRIRTTSFTEPDEWQIRKMKMNKPSDNIKTLRTFSPGHKDCNLYANNLGLYVTNRLENEVMLLKHDGTILFRHKVSIMEQSNIVIR